MSKLQFPQLPLKSDSNLFVSTVIENNNQNGQDLQPRTYAIQDDIISLTDSDQEPNYTELSIDNFDEILECGDGEERLEIAVRKLHSNGLRGGKKLLNSQHHVSRCLRDVKKLIH